MKTNHIILGLLFLALFTTGCQQMPYKVVQLEGTIKYDGQPLDNVILRFTPAEGRASSAHTTSDGSGHFKAKYAPGTMGVQTGQLLVNVTPLSMQGGDVSAASDLEKEVAKKYGYGQSGFPIEVKKASTNFVIDLPK